MTIFKKNHDKSIKCDSKVFMTLDIKHTQFLKEFHTIKMETIPKLINERDSLSATLAETRGRLSMDEIFKLEERIDDITAKINKLKKKERTYMRENVKLVFDYFENKKTLEQSDQQQVGPTMSQKTRNIMSMFNIAPAIPAENVEIVKATNTTNSISTKYLSGIDDQFLDIAKYTYPTDMCSICTTGELIPYEDEGMLICNACFHTFPFLAENEKPSYKEMPKEICFYAYERLNHFKEVLAQFQAKETTQISAEIIDKIQIQIKKSRLVLEKMTNMDFRDILKKLEYGSNYYEHIPYIKHKLGIAPLVMTRELEESLYNDFNELQAPYARHCPNTRENFLNYNYTAYKLCERRGFMQFLPEFHMIKDRNKIIEHDIIWMNMCHELGWTFIPTV